MAAPPAAAQPAPPAESESTFAMTGCEPIRVSRDEIADYEGRYEYWDAKTEIAWEVRDSSPRHEEPRSRLVALVNDIAKMRGRPIAMFGNADLQERDARGDRVQTAQPDESIYLDRPYDMPRIIVVKGDFPLPDVVFEVDLTTDVRDRKLGLYASWDVPELWVEVPDASMPSKRKRPGLTIHILRNGEYRQCAESVTFPGWKAHEIHTALNEPFTSTTSVGTLRRVGEAMGRLSGTGPDDDPFLRAERRLTRFKALREGHEEGRLQERLSALEAVLAARNIHVAGELDGVADRIAAMPRDATLRAALESSDLDDFLRRLRAEQ